ncbi:kinase-like domain-containing protein [Chaetomium fimeti]|uniref:Kinase-like domain-containing protein n=1 Tax=Chaetomium fimeti TaxID=1854472 RepID=A0AAE0HFL1_9PEZI|nr:kinase-like domain-containing protein [Chaetomium fimeti]
MAPSKTRTPSPAAPAYVTAIAPFPGTTFAKSHPTTLLPSPAEIRARNKATGHPKANNPNRPPPVRVPELGLLVKYGTKVTRAEVEAQRYVYRQLQGRVPVPEVMGWAEDAGQGFIYMALVNAPTLAARWTRLTEPERQAICRELKGMVQAWRGLKQDPREVYIGAVGRRPLNDIIVKDESHLYGPWPGSGAVQAFQGACDIDITGQIPIVFTHGDLVTCNILVTQGPNPRVAAVIDWAQAGWYPSYWEWCKAKWVMMTDDNMDDATQEQWRQRYLPLVVQPLPDNTVYYPWLRFSLANL